MFPCVARSLEHPRLPECLVVQNTLFYFCVNFKPRSEHHLGFAERGSEGFLRLQPPMPFPSEDHHPEHKLQQSGVASGCHQPLVHPWIYSRTPSISFSFTLIPPAAEQPPPLSSERVSPSVVTQSIHKRGFLLSLLAKISFGLFLLSFLIEI